MNTLSKTESRQMIRILDQIISDTKRGGSFGKIGMQPTTPARLENGQAVTEGNVTQFIHERNRVWRDTWVIAPADMLRQMLLRFADYTEPAKLETFNETEKRIDGFNRVYDENARRRGQYEEEK